MWIEFQVFFTGLRSKVKCSVLIRWKTDPSHCAAVSISEVRADDPPVRTNCLVTPGLSNDGNVPPVSQVTPLVLSLCNNKHRPWPRISIHMYKCTLHVILFTYIHSTCTNVHSDSDIALHSHKRSTRSGYVCLFQWLGYHTKDMIRAFSGRAQTEISENNGKEEPIMHLGLLRNCLVFSL